jgi:hypothetical protein
MGRDQELVKRSGRDEPMWLAKHMCMETLGISLYSCLYLKLVKMLCLSYLSYFLLKKAGVGWVRGGPNHVYTCE